MARDPARAFADVESAFVVVGVDDLDAFAFEADELRTEIDRTSFFCFVEVCTDGHYHAFEVCVPALCTDISEFGEHYSNIAFLQPSCDFCSFVKRMLETETRESTPISAEVNCNEIETTVNIDRYLYGCIDGHFPCTPFQRLGAAGRGEITWKFESLGQFCAVKFAVLHSAETRLCFAV